MGIFRRVLRLARWMETRPELKVFLSRVCLRKHEHEHPEALLLYSALLRTHLQAETYAIPLPGRSLPQDIVTAFRRLAPPSSLGVPVDGTKRVYDMLLDCMFLSLRHFRWIQTLQEASKTADSCEDVSQRDTHSTSEHRSLLPGHAGAEDGSAPPPKDLCWLSPTEFRSIRCGTFLVAHPLASGIWKQTVILITRVYHGRIEGVIVNKMPLLSAQRGDSPVTRTFLKTLRDVCVATRGGTASSRMARNYAGLLGRDQSTLVPSFPGMPTSRAAQLARRNELRRLWKRHGAFGGVVPDVVMLRRGNPTDALRVVIPGSVAYGFARSGRRVEAGTAPPVGSSAMQEPAGASSSEVPLAQSVSLASRPNNLLEERYFVGTAAWGASQLEGELREGHWIAFTSNNSTTVDRILFQPREQDSIWATLLRSFSEDLYRSSLLPPAIFKKLTQHGEMPARQLPDLAAFLAPFLNGHHAPIVFGKLASADDFLGDESSSSADSDDDSGTFHPHDLEPDDDILPDHHTDEDD